MYSYRCFELSSRQAKLARDTLASVCLSQWLKMTPSSSSGKKNGLEASFGAVTGAGLDMVDDGMGCRWEGVGGNTVVAR